VVSQDYARKTHQQMHQQTPQLLNMTNSFAAFDPIPHGHFVGPLAHSQVPKSPWRGTEEGTNRVEVRCVRHASELVIPSMANLETKRNQA